MASILKVDQIQTAAGGTPTAADLGLNTTGSVLQVVSATATASNDSQSSTPADLTGMSVTITPTNSSTKMLVMYFIHMFIGDGASNGWQCGASRVLRNSTVVFTDESSFNTTYGIGSNNADLGDRHMVNPHYSFIDDHNLSSALTYKVQGWRAQSDGGNIAFNRYGVPGRIIVMEIAG